MKPILIAYAASLISFIILDAIWLGFVAKNFYAEQMAGLLRGSPNWYAAILFYLVYAFAITYLVIAPNAAPAAETTAFANSQWQAVMLAGAIFGLGAYGTYNLTNLAVLEGWPAKATFLDWAWGTALTSVTALSGYAAMTALR